MFKQIPNSIIWFAQNIQPLEKSETVVQSFFITN